MLATFASMRSGQRLFQAMLKLLVVLAIAAGPFTVAHAKAGHHGGMDSKAAHSVQGAGEHAAGLHLAGGSLDCDGDRHNMADQEQSKFDYGCCVGHCDTAIAATFLATPMTPVAMQLALAPTKSVRPGAQPVLQRPPRT